MYCILISLFSFQFQPERTIRFGFKVNRSKRVKNVFQFERMNECMREKEKGRYLSFYNGYCKKEGN